MLARTNDFAYYRGKHSENVAPNVMWTCRILWKVSVVQLMLSFQHLVKKSLHSPHTHTQRSLLLSYLEPAGIACPALLSQWAWIVYHTLPPCAVISFGNPVLFLTFHSHDTLKYQNIEAVLLKRHSKPADLRSIFYSNVKYIHYWNTV